jgi:hypothetical protein
LTAKLTIAWTGAALLCLWVLHANVSPDFTPVRSELAGARGFSRGVFNLVVLPANVPFRHAPPWTLVMCASLFLLVGLKPPISNPRAVHAVAGLAAALLAAVALSPGLTAYRVVLVPRTFALCLVLLAAPRGFLAARAIVARWTPLMTGIAGAAFFASAMLQTLPAYDGNYSGFLHLSRDVAAATPFLQERPALARSLIVYDAGYDGQFMYLMTFDPLLRRFAARPQAYRAFIDHPPYRYGRIGFSAAARLIAAGRQERVPIAMMWLIVAAHAALATLLGALAARHGRSPLVGLWYLAIPAFMSSLMSALPEALAAAGLVGGVLALESRRPWLAAAAFAAALLVRETGIVLVIASLAALASAGDGREWKRSIAVTTAALLPVTMWRLFVASRLFADFGWHAIATNPGDLGVPFVGLVQLWRAGATGIQSPPESIGAIVFPLLLSGGLILAVMLMATADRIERRALAAAAVVYGVVAVSLTYDKIWSHLPSGERGTFELFLCLLLLSLQGGTQPPWARRALAGVFVALGAYTFFVAPDAGASRAALWLIR